MYTITKRGPVFNAHRRVRACHDRTSVFIPGDCKQAECVTAKQVREALDVVKAFDKPSDRIGYMFSLGLDYDRSLMYLPVVEHLDRCLKQSPTYTTNPVSGWLNFMYVAVMFTFKILSTDDD